MSASPIQLGRLEKINLREVWSKEATDFTPWLATEDNLQLLGDTIGMELEYESQEKNVGPYRADILCKDIVTDHWVLIENQLERTDHTHLGQLLTYAAGLNAATIVWIADRFTEEHRAALDWLNRITDNPFNFFGLEVELWKIADSTPAPKFNIVCQPNDWSRNVSAATKTSGTQDGLRLAFWMGFMELVREKAPHIKAGNVTDGAKMVFAVGRSEKTIDVRTDKNVNKLSVVVHLGEPAEESDTNRIESQLQTLPKPDHLPWYVSFGKKRRTYGVAVTRELDLLDQASWPEKHQWALDAILELQNDVLPHLEASDEG